MNLFNKQIENQQSSKFNLSQLLKKTVALSLVSLLSVTSFTASASDYQRTQKELRIMSKIFDASLSDAKVGESNQVFSGRPGTTQSTYLAKQGMVFTFSFSNSEFGSSADWQAFGEGVGRLVGTIASEVTEALSEIDTEMNPVSAPHAPFPGDGWEEKVEAYEVYQKAMEDLRDQQREKREEIRDMQRSIRDMERESRHNRDNEDQLSKIKNKLGEKLEQLTKKKETYEKSMKEYRDKRQQKVVDRNNKKSEIIISTLCDYGSTLRSLEKEEHVTLIFSNYQDNQDQIYVFDYRDVKSCESKDKLVGKAVTYRL
ncbi:MAG: hypothetical protein KUG78_05755 [Kangiellaceae bacterium]|nr:hypothetical protein [Kangiellaceae bacterium]